MSRHQRPHAVPASVVCCAALALTVACGGDDPAASVSNSVTSTSGEAIEDPSATSVTPTGESSAVTSAPTTTATATTIDETWRDELAASCDQLATTFLSIPNPTGPDDLVRFIDDHEAVLAAALDARTIDLPEQLTSGSSDVQTLLMRAEESMATTRLLVTEGRIDGPEFSDTALGSLDVLRFTVVQLATVYATAGVSCGQIDAANAANADLNVPAFMAWQVGIGFDSVWVSNRAEQQVVRIDPITGDVEAQIDVGATPFRLQAADDRMVVRTADAFVFIDPATNKVAATLPKSDIGPSANRGWATDGALWICDGQRLHRHDPRSLEAVATLELSFPCGQVHATTALAIAFAYNEDPGESGAAVAAFIDPATNEVLAEVDLPADVAMPTVLDDVVFFPPLGGSQAVVIDRATWTVVSTPDLGASAPHGSDSATDGTHIYVNLEGGADIGIVDPTTFEVDDTIDPFDFDGPDSGVNAIAVGHGALWVVNDEASILQRFDLPR